MSGEEQGSSSWESSTTSLTQIWFLLSRQKTEHRSSLLDASANFKSAAVRKTLSLGWEDHYLSACIKNKTLHPTVSEAQGLLPSTPTSPLKNIHQSWFPTFIFNTHKPQIKCKKSFLLIFFYFLQSIFCKTKLNEMKFFFVLFCFKTFCEDKLPGR